MSPAAGAVLVASPLLGDPHFARSVVFLIEHSDRGSMGVVVNRPLDTPLGELWPEAPTAIAGTRIAADGGPVGRQGGLILHACPDLPGAQELVPGLAAGGSTDALLARFASGPDRRGPRLFLGHSGWGAGQLDRELAQGAWTVRAGSTAWVLRPPADLWQRLSDGPDPRLAPGLN